MPDLILLVLLILQGVVFISIVVLFVTALLVDRSGLRAPDYETFESRAVLSQRLTLAALVLLIMQTFFVSPLVGAIVALVVAAWMLWWIPASHRRFVVGAEGVFDAPPRSVAAVMFDISQQPLWIDSIVAASLESPGMLREGSVVRQTVRIGGRDLTAKLAVTELVPYERLALTVLVPHPRPVDLYEVAPHERGAQVKSTGAHSLSWANAVLHGWRLPWLRKRLTRQRAAHLEKLRGLVGARTMRG